MRKICNENEISRSAFESWIEKARTYGYDSLRQSKKRGRPPKDSMSRPKKKETQTELRGIALTTLWPRTSSA